MNTLINIGTYVCIPLSLSAVCAHMVDSPIRFSRIGLDYWLYAGLVCTRTILMCVCVCVYGIVTKPCSHMNHTRQVALRNAIVYAVSFPPERVSCSCVIPMYM